MRPEAFAFAALLGVLSIYVLGFGRPARRSRRTALFALDALAKDPGLTLERDPADIVGDPLVAGQIAGRRIHIVPFALTDRHGYLSVTVAARTGCKDPVVVHGPRERSQDPLEGLLPRRWLEAGETGERWLVTAGRGRDADAFVERMGAAQREALAPLANRPDFRSIRVHQTAVEMWLDGIRLEGGTLRGALDGLLRLASRLDNDSLPPPEVRFPPAPIARLPVGRLAAAFSRWLLVAIVLAAAVVTLVRSGLAEEGLPVVLIVTAAAGGACQLALDSVLRLDADERRIMAKHAGIAPAGGRGQDG